MRMTAPVIAGATIALAVALVWYLRPQPESALGPAAESREAETSRVAPPRDEPSAPGQAPAATVAPDREPAIVPAPETPRSPLPGETPVTPMAQMLADRQQNVIVRNDPSTGGFPPGLVEGEQEFAAEPVDSTWAPGAEADLLATFAQMPGLKLIDLQVECRSTMCRFQLTQPTGPPAPGNAMPLDVLRKEFGLTPRWMMAVVDRPNAPTSKSIAYLWRDGFARRECYEDGIATPCPAEADDGGN